MEKIKSYTLLFLLLIFCASLKAQYFPIDTMRLNRAYEAFLHEPDSYLKQIAFLDAFPSSFHDFIMVYQFQEGEDYDLTMYYKGADHINRGLYKLNLVPDTVFCDKIIQLSFGGYWEADAANYLQHLVQKTTRDKSEVMFERLEKFTVGQQVSFWFFFFHSRIKNNGDYIMFKNEMGQRYPRVIKAMEMAYPAASGKVWY